MSQLTEVLSRFGAAGYLLGAQLLAAAVAVAVNFLASMVMTPSDRGDLAFFIQIAYLLTVFVLLGVERPFVARRHGSFGAMVGEALLLIHPGFLLAAIPLVAALFYFIRGENELALSLGILVVFLIGNAFVRVLRVGFIASGVVRPFLLGAVATQIGLLVLSLVLVLCRVGEANVWFGGYALTSLVAVGVVLMTRDSSVNGSVKQHPDLKEVRSSGLRMLPAALGNTAMLRSDRILLPLLAGSAQLGIYIVVATVMELATWPVQQWVDTSLRRWSGEKGENRGSAIRLLLQAGALVFGLAAALGIASYFLIEHLLPPAYLASRALILPLAIASVIYAMTRVQQGLLIARGYSGRVSMVEVIGLVFSFGLYLLLIPNLGGLGAALGSVFGYMAAFIAASIVLLGVNLRKGNLN